jgi:general stress protein YciG
MARPSHITQPCQLPSGRSLSLRPRLAAIPNHVHFSKLSSLQKWLRGQEVVHVAEQTARNAVKNSCGSLCLGSAGRGATQHSMAPLEQAGRQGGEHSMAQHSMAPLEQAGRQGGEHSMAQHSMCRRPLHQAWAVLPQHSAAQHSIAPLAAHDSQAM